VNPYLPAFATICCLAVGCIGLLMVRQRGPAHRFAGPASTESGGQGIVTRLLDRYSDRLAPRATRLFGQRRLASIRRRLDAAGRPGGITIEGYAGKKLLYLILFGLTGALFIAQGRFLAGLFLVVAGWVWLDVWIFRRARLRRNQIDRDLPDFLDIIAVTVAAGVGFGPALRRVSAALGGPLSEEITTALRQMELGATRRDAFVALRDRTNSEFLGQFVTALLQAEELGVPLADALTHLAADMRQGFHQEARRRAARAAPRVSVITSLLVVPGAVILIIGALLIGANFDAGGFLGGG
jgi:tight adherence protein C